MKTSRIVGIVAAATLAAGAVTATTVALAADNGNGSGNSSHHQDGQPAAPDLGMGAQGHPQGQGHGPGKMGGPRGEMGGPRGEMHGPRGEMGGPRGEMGHMLHSEGVIEDADGNYVTVRMQVGEVTAISATSISVKSVDGYTSTYAITDTTEQDRDRTADTQAKVGDKVHVRATVDGSTATAEDIHAMSADFAAQMEEQRAQHEDGMGGDMGHHDDDAEDATQG
ncbi:MAG: hypothetical protein VW362_10910, partial [Candidatus Nanopelagicales bacterium]